MEAKKIISQYEDLLYQVYEVADSIGRQIVLSRLDGSTLIASMLQPYFDRLAPIVAQSFQLPFPEDADEEGVDLSGLQKELEEEKNLNEYLVTDAQYIYCCIRDFIEVVSNDPTKVSKDSILDFLEERKQDLERLLFHAFISNEKYE